MLEIAYFFMLLLSLVSATGQIGSLQPSGFMLKQAVNTRQSKLITSDPIQVQARPFHFQYWNRQLAKIATSVFKLFVYPNGSSVYTATAFLCTVELQGALRNGIYYGFMTVNHGIDAGLIVPTAGARLEAVFDESDRFWLDMHYDTDSWFTDEYLDVTFFQLKPAIIKMMVRRNREFLSVAATPENRNAEFDIGRDLFMFAVASALSEATFISGKVIENRGVPGNIYHDIESMPGTSGGPILDRRTYQILGIHKAHHEELNYRVGVSSWAIVSKMEEYGLVPPATKNESEGWILMMTVQKLAPLFHEAVKMGNLYKVKDIVDEVRSKVKNASPNDAVQIKPLIEHRRQGATPLMEAAEMGHLAIVKFLIRECGADVFYRGNPSAGYSPFLNAAYTGKYDVVKLMLDLRPDLLEARNFYRNTALNFAAIAGHMKIIRLLVEDYKANINSQGFLGRSPLFMAATTSQLEPVKYFVAKRANVTLPSEEKGENVLHFAVSNGDRNVAEVVLAADPCLLLSVDANNETALHRAAYLKDPNMVEFLVSVKNANQTSRNSQGKTPFLVAASSGNLVTMAYLASQGSDLTAVDIVGNNALHMAAQNDSLPIAQFLIMRQSALAMAKNNDGNNPLMIAKKASSKGVLDFLSSRREYYNNTAF